MIDINKLPQNTRIKILVIIIAIPILLAFFFSPYRIQLRGSKKAALNHIKSNCASFSHNQAISSDLFKNEINDKNIECKKHKITATKVIVVSEAEKLNGIESRICVAIRYVFRSNLNSNWTDIPVGLLVTKKDGEYSFNSKTFQCDPNIIESGM